LAAIRQCTEFIMKFEGEVRTFLLPSPLQKGREVFQARLARLDRI
jgi:hypothetical protein